MARKRCEKKLQMDTYLLDQYDKQAKALGEPPVVRNPKGISKEFQKRDQVYRGPKRKRNAPSDADFKIQHEEMAKKRLKMDILFSREDALKTVTPDKFVGTPAVVGLTDETFMNYLRDYTAAMVLFYMTDIPSCTKILPAVREAARTKKNPNHVFAAVDCTEQKELCMAQTIKFVPSFKLYSLGKFVGQFDDNMNAAELKKVLKTVPRISRSDWMLRPEVKECEEGINDDGKTWQDIRGTDYTMSPGRSPTDDTEI